MKVNAPHPSNAGKMLLIFFLKKKLYSHLIYYVESAKIFKMPVKTTSQIRVYIFNGFKTIGKLLKCIA